MSGLFAGSKWEQPVTCEHCSRVLSECDCPRDASGRVRAPSAQAARVSREKRGGGKIVTAISGLDPAASDLPAMLKQFKTICAAGGTIANGRIEIQGDHREKLVGVLRELGYPAKTAGG